MLEWIWRRFGAQYEVGMPDKKARRSILRLILKSHDAEMPGAVDLRLLKVRASSLLAW